MDIVSFGSRQSQSVKAANEALVADAGHLMRAAVAGRCGCSGFHSNVSRLRPNLLEAAIYANMGHSMSYIDTVKMMKATLTERLKITIKKSRKTVFLRDDFVKLGGTYRQLSRALTELQNARLVVRAGYGVYLRPTLTDVESGVAQVQRRLGRRVRREVTINGVTVQLGMPSTAPNKQDVQDLRKLTMARHIIEQFSMMVIRQRSLENMERWQKDGVWVSAFEEWRQLLTKGSDDQVRAVMTGEDQRSNRLRQSAPYAGLLTQTEVEAI